MADYRTDCCRQNSRNYNLFGANIYLLILLDKSGQEDATEDFITPEDRSGVAAPSF